MIMAGHQHVKFVCYPISRSATESGRPQINWIAERTLDPNYQWRREDYNRTAKLDEFLPWFEDWRFDWLDVPSLIRNCPHGLRVSAGRSRPAAALDVRSESR